MARPVQLKHLEAVLQGEYDHAKKKQEVVDRIEALTVFSDNVGRQLGMNVNSARIIVTVKGKEYSVDSSGPAYGMNMFVKGWNAAAPERPLFFVAITVKGQIWLAFFPEDVTDKVESQFLMGVVDSVSKG